MKTLTLDVRERIIASYDRLGKTRTQVAQWFGVSLGMVKKLLQQRRRIGDLAPQHHRAGRKPKILPRHRQQFQTLLKKQPDLTLAELRAATGLTCSLPAIFYALDDLGLTYKKRRSAPANKTEPTLWPPARRGKRRVRHGM
jgi:transposase